jgi:hypothetical protein
MQITSTRRTQQALTPAPTRAVQADPKTSEEPQDTTRLSAAHQTGMATASKWSTEYSRAFGGAVGFALTIPSVYAGLVGGSVAGAVAGMSIGPAVGVISGSSGLGLIKTVFSTGGTVAKGFMVAGAAAGLVGGWVAGNKVGEYTSGVPLSAAGYTIGFAKGLANGEAPEKPQKPDTQEKAELIRRPQGLEKGVAGLLGGVGAISVGLGGAAIGAGAGGGLSLIAGLLAGDVNLASLGTGALIGGGVGVAVGGVVGGLGGSRIVTTTSDALGWAKNKLVPDKEKETLEKLTEEVTAKQTSFESLAGRLDKQTDEASQKFATDQKELEMRQADTADYVEQSDATVQDLKNQGVEYQRGEYAKVDQREETLRAADQKVEKEIEADASVRFKDKRAVTDEKYAELHSQLDEVRDEHQQRDDHLSQIEAAQATEIEQKVVEAYDQKMVPVNEHYDNLTAQQDSRESDLKEWDQRVQTEDQRLDNEIAEKGQADFKTREPGLEREFAGKESNLRQDFRQQTKAADTAHEKAIDAADSRFATNKRAASDRHSNDMAQSDREHSSAMSSERSQHQNNLETEASSHRDGMNRLDRDFESKMNRLESNHRQRMTALTARQTTLQSEKSDLQREKPRLESQLSSAQRDLREAQQALRDANQRWEREVGQAERERNSAVSERNQVSRELESTNSEIRSAEAEKSKWVRQKAQVDSMIVGLRAERDRLQKILDKLK